jgi:hypothetical protein
LYKYRSNVHDEETRMMCHAYCRMPLGCIVTMHVQKNIDIDSNALLHRGGRCAVGLVSQRQGLAVPYQYIPGRCTEEHPSTPATRLGFVTHIHTGSSRYVERHFALQKKSVWLPLYSRACCGSACIPHTGHCFSP